MPDPPSTTLPRWRKIAAWTCLGLAIVLLLASSLTVWVKRQALDTNRWVDASGEMLRNDDIRAALSTRIVNTLFDDANVQQRVSQRLPPQLQPLAAPIVGAIRENAIRAADALLATSQAQALWEQANRVAHSQLVALLEDNKTGAIETDGGNVVLNLGPLAQDLASSLGLDVQLPPEAGRIVIMQSDQLAAAQDGVKTIKALSVFLLIAVAVLLALAVWLAQGFRRRMLLVGAISVVGVGIVLLVVRRLVGNAIVEALSTATNRNAAWSVWLIGTELLKDIAVALLVYGLIGVVGLWLSSRTRWAIALRGRLAPVAREHAWTMFVGVLALFLLILLIPAVSQERRLLGIVILAALILGGVEALRRQILRENPGPVARA